MADDVDPAALAALLALPPDVAARLAISCLTNAARLALRNELIRRSAAARYSGLHRTVAAKRLAAALIAPGTAEDLRQIVAVNAGQQLRWRQLDDVLSGMACWKSLPLQ